MKSSTLRCLHCAGPVDNCSDISTCSEIMEKLYRLEQRVKLLAGYLRDAGYSYCVDESGEYWVRDEK
jgi:hypothetical protein